MNEELELIISEKEMDKFLPGLSKEEKIKRIKDLYGLKFEVHIEIHYTLNYIDENQIEAFREDFINSQ
jgi:hypothetical protein